jgi:alpha-2-macroglobulin
MQKPQECYTLAPSKKDASGIAADSTFVLTSNVRLGAAALGKILTVNPAVSLRVTAIKEGASSTYRIQPKGRLAPNTVYRFRLLDAPNGHVARSWAFQTQAKLRVVQTLPANQATDVPLNVGIELTFSEDGVTGVESRFKIAPATPGRFEVHKRTVVFVPKSLKPATIYTVTLQPGAAVRGSSSRIETPVVFRFETGVTGRSGQAPGGPAVDFSRNVWESATSREPVLSLFNGGGGTPPKSLRVNVYRLNDANAWVSSLRSVLSAPSWAGRARGSLHPRTKGLARAATFNASLQSVGSATGDFFIRFPDRIAAGYYLVQSTVGRESIETWLQVTDIATYSSLTATRTLVWVNDIASKRPLSGARVEVVGGGRLATTANDGVATFNTPPTLLKLTPGTLGYETDSEAVGNLLVTAADGRTTVVPLADVFAGYSGFEFREYEFAGDPAPYWRYLYSDRHLYRQKDTVHFWGLVRKREAPLAATDVVVEITGGEDGETIGRTTVKTTRTGTYIGSIELDGASIGSYNLQASVSNQIVGSTYFEVDDIFKPAYKLDVEPSRRAVFAGEQIAFSTTASFFEGTPVPSLELKYSGDTEGATATGSDGKTDVRYAAPCREGCSPYRWTNMSFGPSLPEEAEIGGGAWAQVFAGAVTLEDVESSVAGGRGVVRGTAYRVDLSRLNGDEAVDYDDYRGKTAGEQAIAADVTEVSYRRVEEGSHYDFISKTVQKSYRYEEVRRSVGTFQVSSDSRGRFIISFPARDDRSYETKLRTSDAAKRIYRRTEWVSSGFFGYGDRFPYLATDDDGVYRLGETVSLTMRKGPAAYPTGGSNRYLFYGARAGIRQHAVSAAPRYSFVFRGPHIPNIDVIGVRFTGETFEEVTQPYTVSLDTSTRQLRIAVEPDKARYQPGEKAKLGIRVTDRAGKAVAGAEVLLSAVDEALFRVEGADFFADLDILESLYEHVSSGILHVHASHQYPIDVPGAEEGGEGGDRGNFKDTGLFRRVTTGRDGRASVEFPIPDNLTSWRITAIAVTEDLYAGRSTSLVPVGLPMFVDVAMNTSYLIGEKPKLPVRAFGDALKAGDPVTFTLSAPTLGQTITAQGKAFATTDIALSPLKEGRHQITVRAAAGSRADGVVRTIEVVPSRLVAVTSRFAEAGVGRVEVRGSKERLTRLVLADHNRGRYYPALEQLSWTYGDRLDQMLARNISQDLLRSYFKEEPGLPSVFHPSRYQRSEGGLAIFPFADNDLTLSARVALLAPNMFGREALARYLRGVLNKADETRERAIIALAGVAALGDPVLDDVQALAARKDLTWRERVWLASAAVGVGDEDTATTIYRALLEQHGEQRGSQARIRVGSDTDDSLEATAIAAEVGARLGDDMAPLLFDYTVANPGGDLLVGLDQIAFLSAALPRLPATPVRVSYTIDGKRENVAFERGQVRTLVLTPKALGSLDLKVEEGTLGVGSFFLAPLDTAKIKPTNEVSIARSYGASSGKTIAVDRGDLVRISLTFGLSSQATGGCYQISDLLPSGLRVVMNPWTHGIQDEAGADAQRLAYPYEVEGQRVSFCVGKGSKSPLIYYARVIGAGSYIAEPALIQSQQVPGVMEVTKSAHVEIK